MQRMCTVQVLLISDVMRRTVFDNLVAPRPSARSICRRLFADDAPVARSSSAVLRDLQAGIEKEAKERWNFDFRTGTPLPGRYQWEPVNPVKSRVSSTESTVTEVPTTKKTDEKQNTPTEQMNRSKNATQSKITGKFYLIFYIHFMVCFI